MLPKVSISDRLGVHPMVRTALFDLLAKPRFGGAMAALFSLAALAIPTILLLFHVVPSDACCVTYVPFVLLSASLLSPTYALIVAVGSTGLTDALFMGPRYQLLEGSKDLFGDASLFLPSAFVIGLIFLFRRMIAQSRQSPTPQGIVFGLEKGDPWAMLRGSDELDPPASSPGSECK